MNTLPSSFLIPIIIYYCKSFQSLSYLAINQQKGEIKFKKSPGKAIIKKNFFARFQSGLTVGPKFSDPIVLRILFPPVKCNQHLRRKKGSLECKTISLFLSYHNSGMPGGTDLLKSRTWTKNNSGEVVVAQLVKWSLPAPEVNCLNHISNIIERFSLN